MRMVREFQGRFRFLSNFFPSPIMWNGKVWPTAEHLFQAMKTEDPKIQEKIRQANKPGEAKRLGYEVVPKPNWKTIKRQMMLLILRMKFKQNPKLIQKLIDTGDMKLIEGNYWHDNYFGVCKCHRCKNKEKHNHLGKLLMQLRKEISK